MWIRSNRSRYREDEKPAADEKLIGFRMSQARYDALREIAKKRRDPIAVLINEAIEAKFKLSKKAKVGVDGKKDGKNPVY
jgi:hypothetical protein